MDKTYFSGWGVCKISEIDTGNGNIKIGVKWYRIQYLRTGKSLSDKLEGRTWSGLEISYLLKFHETSILWGKEYEQGLGISIG